MFHTKVNTALQLVLMGITTVHPILPFDLGIALQGLQYVSQPLYIKALAHSVNRWTVATTTIWSGLSYVFSKNAVRIISERRKPEP